MILNLTQHKATPAQIAAGVVDAEGDSLALIVEALTFATLPAREEIEGRARLLAIHAEELAKGEPSQVMIGGAPYLMTALECALIAQGLVPVYAFSIRESVEQTQPDGSVRKVNVFRHAGFVTCRHAGFVT